MGWGVESAEKRMMRMEEGGRGEEWGARWEDCVSGWGCDGGEGVGDVSHRFESLVGGGVIMHLV